MCGNGECCEKPEQLKGRPQECSPEQIKICHGSETDHPLSSGKRTSSTRRLSSRCGSLTLLPERAYLGATWRPT